MSIYTIHEQFGNFSRKVYTAESFDEAYEWLYEEFLQASSDEDSVYFTSSGDEDEMLELFMSNYTILEDNKVIEQRSIK